MDASTVIAIVCYVEWGLIHILAGFAVWTPQLGGNACCGGPAAAGTVPLGLMSAMSDDEKKAFTDVTYPKFAHRVMIQHGWNLFYVGVWAILSIIPLLNEWRTAWLFGLHQYLFDWGYFVAIDWVGRGGPIGQAQTFIVSAGLICSAVSVNNYVPGGVPDSELALEIFIGALLIAAGIFGIVRERVCPTCMDCSGPGALTSASTEV